MRTFEISSPKYLGELRFTFRRNVLIDFDNKSALNLKQIECFEKDFPFTLERLEKLIKLYSFKVKEVSDYSFDAFWNLYNYKKGNKDRAEKLWNELPKEERSECLDAVSIYNVSLDYDEEKRRNEKQLPETYLNQKNYKDKF